VACLSQETSQPGACDADFSTAFSWTIALLAAVRNGT
jgi:hypothetical protein